MASPDRNFANSAIFTQAATGTTPNVGDNSLYFKSDDKVYSKNSSGVETQITPATGTVTSVTGTSPITSTGGATPVISTSMATNKLLGRSTAGTGVAEEISIGTGLSLTAGTLSNAGVLSDTTAAQGGTQLLNMVQITSAAYSAIVTPTANTLYIIVG